MNTIYQKYVSTIAITGISLVLGLALYVSFPEIQTPVTIASVSELGDFDV